MFGSDLRKRAQVAYWRSIRRRSLARPSVDQVQLERLRAAIVSMPALTREVFEMHRFEDLAYGRIAVRLGIRIDEVEAHLVVALMHLMRATPDGDR